MRIATAFQTPLLLTSFHRILSLSSSPSPLSPSFCLHHHPTPVLSLVPPPSSPSFRSWFQAAKSSDIPTLTRLIRTGSIPNALVRDSTSNRTALHFAAASADVATVRALFEIARGIGGATQHFSHHTNDALALINLTDKEGCTSLHFAAARADEEGLYVVKTLILYGADVTMREERGLSPADIAARSDVVQVLTQAS